MERYFEYHNVKFKKHERGNWAVVRGEITNKSGRDYSSVVFRIIVFKRSIPISSVIFALNGFISGQTRLFEKYIEDLDYYKLLQDMTNYELYAESAY